MRTYLFFKDGVYHRIIFGHKGKMFFVRVNDDSPLWEGRNWRTGLETLEAQKKEHLATGWTETQ